MRSPYLDALLNPLNLATLALAAAAGLCSAWWLFPIGVLVWGGMILIHANDPELRLNYKQQERSAALSQRFQAQFDKVSRSQIRILNAVNSARGPLRGALGPAEGEVEALTDEVYDLCQRMTGPENYYKVAQRDNALADERALAVMAVETAATPEVKREKQDALAAVDKRLQQMKEMGALLDRVEAHIEGVSNEMAGWLADIVRLQAAGAKDASGPVQALIAKVKTQREALKTFDQDLARLS